MRSERSATHLPLVKWVCRIDSHGRKIHIVSLDILDRGLYSTATAPVPLIIWNYIFFCRSKCPDITRQKSFHFHCPNSENITFSFQYFSRRNPHFQPSLSRQLIPKTGFWRPPGVKFINQHNFDPPIQIFLTKNAISRAKLRSTL